MSSDRQPHAFKATSSLRTSIKPIQALALSISQRFRAASLRFKIAFFTVILLTCTSFVLCFLTIQIMNDYILNEIIKRGESVGKSIAASAGYSLLSRDLLALDTLVYKAKTSNSDMPYVAIVDPAMKAIVHSSAPLSGETMHAPRGSLFRRAADGTTIRELSKSSGTIFEITCPISFMEQPLGNVILGVNRSVLIEAQGKIMDRILMIFGIIVALGTLASSMLASFLIRPIKELSAGVDELKKGMANKELTI